MKFRARLTAALLATLATAGVSAAQAADVNFITDFGFNGRHAYFYVAREKGYYKAEGFDVNFVRGQGSADAIKKVAAGVATFGFADAGSLWGYEGGTTFENVSGWQNNLVDCSSISGSKTKGYANVCVADSDSIRSSVGVSLLWKSPFGPLTSEISITVFVRWVAGLSR